MRYALFCLCFFFILNSSFWFAAAGFQNMFDLLSTLIDPVAVCVRCMHAQQAAHHPGGGGRRVIWLEFEGFFLKGYRV